MASTKDGLVRLTINVSDYKLVEDALLMFGVNWATSTSQSGRDKGVIVKHLVEQLGEQFHAQTK